MDSKYYSHWHLASNELEYKVTEFEWSIIRCYEAFSRWLATAGAIVADGDLKVSEYLILQVIRMLDRPRNGMTIARMLNRDDVANVQYSLRKLESHGLIQKIKEPGSKIHAFDVTDKGKKACEEFSVIRRDLSSPSCGAAKVRTSSRGRRTRLKGLARTSFPARWT